MFGFHTKKLSVESVWYRTEVADLGPVICACFGDTAAGGAGPGTGLLCE